MASYLPVAAPLPEALQRRTNEVWSPGEPAGLLGDEAGGGGSGEKREESVVAPPTHIPRLCLSLIGLAKKKRKRGDALASCVANRYQFMSACRFFPRLRPPPPPPHRPPLRPPERIVQRHQQPL